MPMNEPDRELLQRYLSGSASQAECELVEAWLAGNPDRWARLAAIRDALEAADLSDDSMQAAMDEVWARLRQSVGPIQTGSTGPRLRRAPARDRSFVVTSPGPGWRTMFAAAAAVAVVASTAIGFLMLHPRNHTSAEATKVINTGRGERVEFRLKDGTKVMLGVASTLRYPPEFSRGSREVSLEGEAYFDVVHDAERPFTVRAGNLVVRDLGTQFTARAYPEDVGGRVVVREGRVAIRSANVTPSAATTERIVAAGQLGRLSLAGEPAIETADTAAYFAWTEGRLVLDSVPLREALPELSRWFDLDFRLGDSALAGLPLSATLRTKPTPDVLTSLAASLGLHIRQSNRIVTLYSVDQPR